MNRHDYASLASAPRAELEAVLRAGHPPDLEGLAGSEFRGWNTPFFASWIGILRFKKGFFRDPKAGGRVRGYNKAIRSGGGLNDPWVEKGPGDVASPFGFYEVEIPDDDRYPNSVLLNYNCPRNFLADPTRLLRDYLVQVDADNPDLLLGKAYLATPPIWPRVSYFLLERVGDSVVPD